MSRGAVGVDRQGRPWFAGYARIFLVDGDILTRFALPDSPAIEAVVGGRGLGKDAVYIATNGGFPSKVLHATSKFPPAVADLFRKAKRLLASARSLRPERA